MEGKGTFSHSNRDVCKGQWVANKMQGEFEMWFNNGNKYVGEVMHGVKEGSGIYTFVEGDV